MDASIQAVIIGGLAGLLTGAIPVIYQAWRDKRNAPQDEISKGVQVSNTAADTVSKYALELRQTRDEMAKMRIDYDAKLSLYATELVQLRKELDARDEIISDWTYGIERLVGQLVSLGHNPVWRPKVTTTKGAAD